MKVTLYFILFIGFMLTVTVVDRLTSGPLVKLSPSKEAGEPITFSANDENDPSLSKQKLDQDTSFYKTKYSKGFEAGVQKLTKGTLINKSKYSKGFEANTQKITKDTKLNRPKIRSDEVNNKKTKRRNSNKKKTSGKEVIYKGDDYSVFTLSNGKLKMEMKIWFDYMNPPSKKLRREKYKKTWNKKGCCLWRNGEHYDVVFESNLFFEVGQKKIPAKK
jgi:hypothetical protein